MKSKELMATRQIEELLQTQNDLLRDQLIIQLGALGVPQQTIRSIVGVDMKRVTAILRHLKKLKLNKK